MNKKFLSLIFVIAILIVPCALLFSGCDKNANGGESNGVGEQYSPTTISVHVLDETYEVEAGSDWTIDNLEQPNVSGYSFDGWVYDNNGVLTLVDSNFVYNKNITSIYSNLVNQDLEFELTTNAGNTYTVKKYNGTDTKVVIPNFYNGLKVVKIGQECFYENNTVEEVYLPAYCDEICNYAFYHCINGLKKVDFIVRKSSSMIIGNGAFISCLQLKAFNFFSGLTSIGEYAFSSCSQLKSVSLPISVTALGKSAFTSCGNLTEVFGLDNVIEIKDETFKDCRKLERIELSSSTTYIGKKAFYCCEKLSELTIPSSVSFVGTDAFWFCVALNKISIKSPYVYNNLLTKQSLGYLSFYSTKIEVLTSVVNNTQNSNSYLNNESNFTKSTRDKWTVYDRVGTN